MFSILPLKSKTFLKHALTYLLIFVTTVTAMGIVMYQNAVVNFQKEIEQSNIHKLQQIKDFTDLRMRELNDIASRIAYDPKLTPYKLQKDDYSAIEAIDQLKNYKINSAIIEELFIYFREQNGVYSSKGYSSLDTLAREVYPVHQEGDDALRRLLNTVSIPQIIPAQEIVTSGNKRMNALVWLYPTPPNRGAPYGTVMMIIKEAMLTDWIDHILNDFQGSVYILNEENQILASKTGDPTTAFSRISPYLSLPEEAGIGSFKAEGKEYSMARVSSEQTGWTYITAMPTDQFFSRVAETKTIIYMVTAALLVVGSFLILLFSFRHFRPLRDVMLELKEHMAEGRSAVAAANEFAQIKQGIQMMAQKQSNLQQQVELHRPLLQEQFLIHLLKGHYKRNDDDPSGLHYQLSFPYSHYFVIVASWHKVRLSMEQWEQAVNTIINVRFAYTVGYGMEMMDGKSFAMIVNFDPHNSVPVHQREIVSSILSMLHPVLETENVGVGRVYPDLLQTNRSFIEALAANDLYSNRTKEGFVVFDEIAEMPMSNQWYAMTDQMKYMQSLKMGDQEIALETLEDMFRRMEEQPVSLLLVKCMVYDIVNTILKTLSEAQLDGSIQMQMLRELLGQNTLEEMKLSLRQLTVKICDNIEQRTKHLNQNRSLSMMNYVHQQFKSSEMSLEHVADCFQLTATQLSRIFKQQTNLTFTDYIIKLRLEYVKQQLIDTEDPIKEIILQSGYLDVSSFIRSFKKIEGITPGQYRILKRTAADRVAY